MISTSTKIFTIVGGRGKGRLGTGSSLMESIPALLVSTAITSGGAQQNMKHLMEQENYLVSQQESNDKNEGKTDVS